MKNKPNIQLKFHQLKFYDIFHESMIQCQMKFQEDYDLTVLMFSYEFPNAINSSTDKVNKIEKDDSF